jgi:hypothetical protein
MLWPGCVVLLCVCVCLSLRVVWAPLRVSGGLLDVCSEYTAPCCVHGCCVAAVCHTNVMPAQLFGLMLCPAAL